MKKLSGPLLVSILALPHLVFANVIGSDAQNFNPTTSGLDFVTVHSSETLEPGVFNLGLFLNYAVNTLPYFPAPGGTVSQGRADFNDAFLGGDLNLGVGLLRNWDIGISFPVLLDQEVDNTGGVGFYKEGLTEIRLNSKLRLFGDSAGGVAVIGSANFNQIKNNPFAGADAGPTFNLELSGDLTWNRWALGLNLGRRFRDAGTPMAGVAIDPTRDQWLASAAASYLLAQVDTKLIFEIFSAFPADSSGQNQSDRELTAIEGLAGVKHDLTSQIALHAGFGTELLHGASSPDWRVYAGLNWAFGPLFSREKNVEVERDVRSRDLEVPATAAVPAATPPAKYQRIRIKNLNFLTGKSDLNKQSAPIVEELIAAIQEIQKTSAIKQISVEGHSDSIGAEDMNQRLSEARAETVKKILMARLQMSAEQVSAVGYGETQPIADNGNYQGRAKNRRVEFKIITEGDL